MRCFLLYPIEHMWLKKLCICLITDEYYLNCCMKLVLVTTIVAFGKINISDLLGLAILEALSEVHNPNRSAHRARALNGARLGAVAGRPIGSAGGDSLAQ
jgi:hypothetical protein